MYWFINKEKSKTDRREILTYGYSWMQYPMLAALVFQVLYLINFPNIGFYYTLCTISILCLYLTFKQARKIKYDQKNLYIIKFKKEKTIPFTNIISIKKSKSKINGSRYWKLKYSLSNQEATTIRFFSDFNKSFHRLVRSANPDVIIWTHPHFHN